MGGSTLIDGIVARKPHLWIDIYRLIHKDGIVTLQGYVCYSSIGMTLVQGSKETMMDPPY